MSIINIQEKEKQLKEINQKLNSLLETERNWLANMANAAALLYNNLEDLNWAGFYLFKNSELVLGPFQGLTACIRIKKGQGVCGQALQDEKTYLVKDVHQFEGHIACDPVSNSEIVIPLKKDSEVLGVLDIDSPEKARFDQTDQKYLEKFVNILLERIDVQDLKNYLNN